MSEDLKNKSKLLRKEDVVDMATSVATNLPVSAKQVYDLHARISDLVRVGVPDVPVAASVSLALATNPEAADEIYVGDETFVFVEAAKDPVVATEVVIGLNAEATQASLKTAIDTVLDGIVTVGTWSANAVTITADVKGVIGNSIEVDSALTAEADGFGTKTHLEGGVDGTVAVASTIMVDKTNHKLWVAEDTCTTAVSNWKYVELS